MISIKILLLILSLCFIPFPVSAGNETDSIRQLLPHLQGEEKLSALSSLRSLAHADGNKDEEYRWINEYIKEAKRQNDVECIGDALLSRLYFFENYEMTDSIHKYHKNAIAEMRAFKAWDWMYNCWDVAVQYDLYHDRLESALRKAKKMYDDARQNKSYYGIGVALFDMGTIYQAIGRTDDAVYALRESVKTLRGEDNITLLLSAYNYLCSSLDGLGQYDEILQHTEDWKSVIDGYEKKAVSMGYTVSLDGKKLYNELAACVAEIGRGNLQNAGRHLSLAQEYARGRSASAQYKLLLTECRYYTAAGDYDKAIESGRKNAEMLRELGDSVSLATMETQLAEAYFRGDNFKEASALYRKLLPEKENLRVAELSRRLDEMRTMYEIDTLALESEASRVKLIGVASIVIFLLIVLMVTAAYLIRLRKKNKVFYDIIQKQETREKMMKIADAKAEDDPIGEEEDRLFSVVKSLMENNELYKDPTLNRESLAIAAGSNTVYLAEAIKRNMGQTVSEYITSYRLAHAAKMLSENPKAGIGEVEVDSGFNSRSTFSRLFKMRYGMSPTEYRAVSRGKKS